MRDLGVLCYLYNIFVFFVTYITNLLARVDIMSKLYV